MASENINQIYIANPITSNASTDLMYFGQSPYGAGNDAAMTYANFSAQFGAPYTAAALTKTDDTNVTLTLGGTPSTALLHATSLTLGWTGTLSGTRGGTGVNNGASTITVGGNVAFSGAFTFTGTLTGNTGVTFPTSGTLATTSQLPTPAALTQVNDTNVTLTLGGTPATSLLQAVSITAGWTGTLSGTRGGTGVNNGSSTITVGGNFAMSGAFAFTGTLTNTTSVTFPTSGTLATTSQLPTPAALTRTNDTNVTLTLGGTPSTALLQATSLTLGWTGQLGLARGGTNTDLSATGGTSQVLKQTTVGGNITVAQLAVTDLSTATTGSGSIVLATSPTLVTPALGTPLSGTLTNCTGLPVAGGGTGNSTFTAYSVICAGTTATGAFQNVSGLGSSGQVLTSNGAAALPTWQAAGGGGSVNYAVDSGAVNAMVATIAGISSYTDGLVVYIYPAHTSTSANVTLNINGLGAQSVLLYGSVSPAIGDIYHYATHQLIYNSAQGTFYLLNPATSNLMIYQMLAQGPGSGPGTIFLAQNAAFSSNAYTCNNYFYAINNFNGAVLGLTLDMVAAGTNTGASTLNYSSTGVKSIILANGNALTGGEIVNGGIYRFVYDGTHYVLQNPSVIKSAAIYGTTTNNNATAGYIGEYISSNIASASAVSITSASDTNITSISLTAGDWDVWALGITKPAAGTTTSLTTFGISQTSATMPTPSDTAGYVSDAAAISASTSEALPTSTCRISLSTTTTVYLVANITFAVSTMAGYGYIAARRVR